MSELRTIRYDDGRWCEQEYVNGKLHGRWTVFYANGRKHWERQLSNGRQEGYQRTWDETGRLVEEQWYHLGELHGSWRRWTDAGEAEVVGDFVCGYRKEVLENTINEDFNRLVKLYYALEPAEFANQVGPFLEGVRRKTLRMQKADDNGLDLSRHGSFWNYVNVLGANEEWPCCDGHPLFPILQINCTEVRLRDNPLADFSFVTLFALAGGVLRAFGEDIVVRAYHCKEKVVRAESPVEGLEAPARLCFSEETSYPDENDLPPGFRVLLEEHGDEEGVLTQDSKLNSRLGGWPGWLQSGRVSGFGRFAFQADSLDVEGWDCGDCAIHYFFLNHRGDGFDWYQEMC
jgi:hypothetical protein